MGRPTFVETSDPIAYLYAEHYRHRLCCDALEHLDDEPPGGERAAMAALLVDFLESDLPAHCMDENANLFPLLMRRCRNGDGAGDLLQWAAFDATAKSQLVVRLLPGLRTLAQSRGLGSPLHFFQACGRFATLHRRQIAWENAIILPLARKWLTAEDLYVLSKRLTVRHAAAVLRRRRASGSVAQDEISFVPEDFLAPCRAAPAGVALGRHGGFMPVSGRDSEVPAW